MPLVGICTYIVVFNVNRIATFIIQSKAALPTHESLKQQKNATEKVANGTTRTREALSGGTGALKGSSPWRKVHYCAQRLLPNVWVLLLRVRKFIPHRSKRMQDFEEPRPVSLGDLRDVHVKVQVDVESCNES